MARAGCAVDAGDSPIIPMIMGPEQSALDAAKILLDRGMLVAAVRPPSVPRGQSRLRITISSEHSDRQIDDLLDALTRADIAELITPNGR